MIGIKGDIGKIEVDLQNKINNLNNIDRVLERIAQDMKKETQLNFRKSTSPDGTKWQELSPITIAGRKKKSNKPLVDRGTLRRSIRATVEGNQAVIGTNLKYAGIHQFGGTVKKDSGKKNMYWKHNKRTGSLKMVRKSKANFMTEHKMKKHSVSIPARPYMGINRNMLYRYRKWLVE